MFLLPLITISLSGALSGQKSKHDLKPNLQTERQKDMKLIKQESIHAALKAAPEVAANFECYENVLSQKVRDIETGHNGRLPTEEVYTTDDHRIFFISNDNGVKIINELASVHSMISDSNLRLAFIKDGELIDSGIELPNNRESRDTIKSAPKLMILNID